MSLRDSMPMTAWLVDVARDLCGATEINEQVRAGMAGQADRFHAVENGRTVGTPMAAAEGVTVAQMAPLVLPESDAPKKVGRGR
jgi:hypothetical protein